MLLNALIKCKELNSKSAVDLLQGDPYVFSPYESHERACAATWLIHHFELLRNAGL